MKSAMRAAWKLDAYGGMARMKKLAEWLERDYPAAAASLREGLEDCFTINRLDVPPSLHRCLATTNVIESPHSGRRCARAAQSSRWRRRKSYGETLDGVGLPGYRKELPQDHGLP